MICLVDSRIPIKRSVELLDKRFPHLMAVTWNDREDRKARQLKREQEQNGVLNQQGVYCREVGQGCGVEAYPEREDGD